ncbi:molybdopterin converting factor, small subunit [Candidatus Caldarchaeum subterraneum]|uniref:Molybdopterin converting factor, small subunit n=1 Tax=Caldiarchaeum subterraneum TaxID=311458 RepID=E6N5J9_CALS0|nr:molybdopterin converting factor, small subunit [Candidatus Caldarchaeum subterraneum]BAJ50386.1 molybdopterin converting factor, small subunit [Candidatus Caldarchaeum subterraneum]
MKCHIDLLEMALTVNFYSSYLRRAAGGETIRLEESPRTVRELLDLLAAKLGKSFEELVYDPRQKTLKRAIVLLVNGHSIKMLKGLDTPLHPDDNVSIDTVEVIEVVGGG